ncbi:MAG: WXG100 family type VII secretion target [Erysipelotrichaceae bacterium]|nr:WXG100 family type VII secretion target [Erysipelotrichaceae bacterium]
MQIQVNTNDVRMSASRLRQKAGQYENLVSQMYAKIQHIDSIWQGADSAAFMEQIQAFRPALNELKTIQESYASLLDQSASAYDSLQSQRAASARML